MAASPVLRVVRLTPGARVPIWEMLRVEEGLYRSTRAPDSQKVGWCFLNHPGHTQTPTVVLGFSGKIPRLVNESERSARGVGLLRRFTGGGTVVVDHNTVFASWLLNTDLLPEVKPFPRNIMDWSGRFYMRAMQNAGVKDFALRADDYVVGDVKVAGNAQAISGNKWIHHTSFLYDFDDDLMSVLHVPEKQPEYRANRNHLDFLQRLRSVMPPHAGSESPQADESSGPARFLDAVELAIREEFAERGVTVERAQWEDAVAEVAAYPPSRRVTRWELEVR